MLDKKMEKALNKQINAEFFGLPVHGHGGGTAGKGLVGEARARILTVQAQKRPLARDEDLRLRR